MPFRLELLNISYAAAPLLCQYDLVGGAAVTIDSTLITHVYLAKHVHGSSYLYTYICSTAVGCKQIRTLCTTSLCSLVAVTHILQIILEATLPWYNR